MTNFCLIRHGQTDWNLEGRYQGQSDVSLNETGLSQARELVLKFADYRFAAIYSSDLSRALETARIVADPLDLTVTVDERLREINQGEWEGLLVKTIRDRYDRLWQNRVVDPASIRPPGGETVEEVAQRAYVALDEIAEHHPTENVLIVSHGLTLATIICKAKGVPIGLAYQMIPNNALPTWVEWPVKEGVH